MAERGPSLGGGAATIARGGGGISRGPSISRGGEGYRSAGFSLNKAGFSKPRAEGPQLNFSTSKFAAKAPEGPRMTAMRSAVSSPVSKDTSPKSVPSPRISSPAAHKEFGVKPSDSNTKKIVDGPNVAKSPKSVEIKSMSTVIRSNGPADIKSSEQVGPRPRLITFPDAKHDALLGGAYHRGTTESNRIRATALKKQETSKASPAKTTLAGRIRGAVPFDVTNPVHTGQRNPNTFETPIGIRNPNQITGSHIPSRWDVIRPDARPSSTRPIVTETTRKPLARSEQVSAVSSVNQRNLSLPEVSNSSQADAQERVAVKQKIDAITQILRQEAGASADRTVAVVGDNIAGKIKAKPFASPARVEVPTIGVLPKPDIAMQPKVDEIEEKIAEVKVNPIVTGTVSGELMKQLMETREKRKARMNESAKVENKEKAAQAVSTNTSELQVKKSKSKFEVVKKTMKEKFQERQAKKVKYVYDKDTDQRRISRAASALTVLSNGQKNRIVSVDALLSYIGSTPVICHLAQLMGLKLGGDEVGFTQQVQSGGDGTASELMRNVIEAAATNPAIAVRQDGDKARKEDIDRVVDENKQSSDSELALAA